MSELKEADLSKAPGPAEEPKQDEEATTEKEAPTADKALWDLPGAPDKTQIEQWKAKHGEVLVSGFSGTELFVFRPLTREEFVNLQTVISQAQQPVGQFEIEDKICETCLLWVSEAAQESMLNKAGSLSTLHEQVMQASNFVDPRYAASFVVRL